MYRCIDNWKCKSCLNVIRPTEESPFGCYRDQCVTNLNAITSHFEYILHAVNRLDLKPDHRGVDRHKLLIHLHEEVAKITNLELSTNLMLRLQIIKSLL